jgi:hypothetical protein
MAKIIPGRYAAKMDRPFALFIIGMRFNNLLAVRRWVSVARAMPAMLRELEDFSDKGLLHYESIYYWRGAASIQYWESFDHLERYAREPGGTHARAWAEFRRKVGDDGSVGIWHETYRIQPGQFECIYGNMPRFGLGAAAEHVPALGPLENARDRMRQREAAE